MPVYVQVVGRLRPDERLQQRCGVTAALGPIYQRPACIRVEAPAIQRPALKVTVIRRDDAQQPRRFENTQEFIEHHPEHVRMPKARTANDSVYTLGLERQGTGAVQDDIHAQPLSCIDANAFKALRADVLRRATQVLHTHDDDLGANRQVVAVGLEKEPTIIMCREVHL
ncbi:hypothetical protein D3C80_1382150 [compost metagenome]